MLLDITLLAIIDPVQMIDSVLNATPVMVYTLVFLLMVVESSFIPFPSEVIVPPAAYLACTSHEVNIMVILLLATAGALGGALINRSEEHTSELQSR